jgi:hypothetical protein
MFNHRLDNLFWLDNKVKKNELVYFTRQASNLPASQPASQHFNKHSSGK